MYLYKRLSETDADAMLALQRECLAEPGSLLMASSPQAYRRAFQFENFALGALYEGALAGFATCAPHNRRSRMNLGRHLGYSDDELDRVAHINVVLVSPAHRGRGVAAELVRRSLAAIPSRHDRVLATTAPENRAALALLSRFGFERVGTCELGGCRRAIYALRRDADQNKGPRADAPARPPEAT